MSWPCPDCAEPFVPNHMCREMRHQLSKPNSQRTWRWMARTMMLESRGMQQAFLIEEDLRVNTLSEMEAEVTDPNG